MRSWVTRNVPRRGFLLTMLALLAGFLGLKAHAAQRSEGLNAGPVETPALRDLLEKGLKARRPVEFEFIDKVLALVDQGTLPRSMVRGTFLWARRKHGRPFQYFEFGLRQRAKEELGIEI